VKSLRNTGGGVEELDEQEATKKDLGLHCRGKRRKKEGTGPGPVLRGNVRLNRLRTLVSARSALHSRGTRQKEGASGGEDQEAQSRRKQPIVSQTGLNQFLKRGSFCIGTGGGDRDQPKQRRVIIKNKGKLWKR